MTDEQLIEILKKVNYPGTYKDIYSMNLVEKCVIDWKRAQVIVTMTEGNNAYKSDLHVGIVSAIEKQYPEINVDVHFKAHTNGQAHDQDSFSKGIKNIIAIGSGKGGVGKSTIAANLAISLADQGFKVGLVDTDLYGPSMPIMFGLQGKRPEIREVNGRDVIVPLEVHGISLMSIGFLLPAQKAMVMRGPRLAGIIKQFFNQVLWPELDYLIVDLPPGTGDIQLSLVQTVSVTGAIIVTTPQRLAVADAIKAANMFVSDPINVPLLGIVENMSWFTPLEDPDKKYYLFGKGGGRQLATLHKTQLLGQIPLVQSIGEGGDKGKPVGLDKDSIESAYFEELTIRLVRQVAQRNKQSEATKILQIKVH